jgi:hypothetical protein
VKEYARPSYDVFAHFVLKWLHHLLLWYVTLLQAVACLHDSTHFVRVAACLEEARNATSPVPLHFLPKPTATKPRRPDFADWNVTAVADFEVTTFVHDVL